jgi:serine/threonine protein phosphatase PrpC
LAKGVTQLRVGAASDVGRKRDHNEDDYAVVEQYKNRETRKVAEVRGSLFLVADGMGGHNAGEVASRTAADVIPELYYRKLSPDVAGGLRQAIEGANRRIYERAQQSLQETGMGSTVVAAVIRGDELHIAHAGDSRAYLVRDEQILQLTRDHSWVAEQMDAGLISPAEARTHPYRNYITRALGLSPEVEIDSQMLTIREGDVILLCSDGLSGPLADDKLQQIVAGAEPAEACEELIRQANAQGGPDNITAIVIHVEQVVPVGAASHAAPLERAGAAAAGQPQTAIRGLAQDPAVRLEKKGPGRLRRDLRPILNGVLGLALCGLITILGILVARRFLNTPPAERATPAYTSMPTPPISPTAAPSATPTPAPTPLLEVITPWGVNLHSAPDTQAAVIDVALKGTRLEVMGCYRAGDGSEWLKVCCVGPDSLAGWVIGDPENVKAARPCSDVPQLTYP